MLYRGEGGVVEGGVVRGADGVDYFVVCMLTDTAAQVVSEL